MISIHEARKLSTSNGQKLRNNLPTWLEEVIDDRIMDAASRGHSSLCLRLSRFDKLSDEEIDAVLQAYTDYSPRYYSLDNEDDNVLYFFWD
jgi:hypothetical protein